MVIAALMLAGFLWMAFAYSGQSSSGYGRRKRDAFNVNEGTHKHTYVHQCFTFKRILDYKQNDSKTFEMAKLCNLAGLNNVDSGILEKDGKSALSC